MMGENAVRLSATSIWSTAASMPWRMIAAVTGSTVVRGSACMVIGSVSLSARGLGDDERPALVDAALRAGVEVRRGGRLEHDGRAGERVAGGQRLALGDGEVPPCVLAERVRARRAVLGGRRRAVGRTRPARRLGQDR